MTLLAVGGESTRLVVRGGCVHEFCGVTGKAIRGQSRELSVGRTLVTLITLDGRMSAKQWKAILVLFDRPDRHVPAVYGMALFAASSHLPSVNVSMTVCAIVTHVPKHQSDVALSTGNVLVHAPQRIAGFIMIEFGNVTYRLPTGERVAVLTINV